jgi:RNA polymerase sigma-70 factor (ECF subfamily)
VNPPRSETASPPAVDLPRWFAAEVQPHETVLRGYLHRSFPAVRDIDDLVQESYLRVWKARAAQPIRSAKAFLFTVARRLALDHVRSQRRSPICAVTDLSHLFVLESAPNAREATATSEEVALLVEAVEALPARCREIFVLRRLQGVPQKDIAVRLGLSEQTVQVQAARGMRRCSEYLHRRLRQT